MEKEKAATDGTSDGAIIKPFLIDGGQLVVEVDTTTDPQRILFSVRGVVPHKHLSKAIKAAEDFLTKTLIDNERLSS